MPTYPIRSNVCLRDYNYLGLDVRARYFLDGGTIPAIQEGLHFARKNQLPVLLLGAGSNVVFAGDYPGLVIRISLTGISLQRHQGGAVIVAAAGENWHQLVGHTLGEGLYGLENLALIPGTVGAAPVQNIGAYGAELSDVLLYVNVLDRNTLIESSMPRDDCGLSYRDSVFKSTGRYVITSVALGLSEQSQLNARYAPIQQELKKMGVEDHTGADIYRAVCNVRKQRLPDVTLTGNVGSFFKNPIISIERFSQLREVHADIPGIPTGTEVKIPAAWLIEHSHLKGVSQGGAMVSPLHALVLINTGNAVPADILQLKDRIQSTVREHYGLELEIEPTIVSCN
jgi:UDP-N-acetylmuramate dehydrogenase